MGTTSVTARQGSPRPLPASPRPLPASHSLIQPRVRKRVRGELRSSDRDGGGPSSRTRMKRPQTASKRGKMCCERAQRASDSGLSRRVSVSYDCQLDAGAGSIEPQRQENRAKDGRPAMAPSESKTEFKRNFDIFLAVCNTRSRESIFLTHR